ncbi:Glutathione S-transferase U18 [Glycine soja]|uniref:Glutathione S-transferase U18 n=2 Tax=Glycine soja TaxID=3848 RepID=A0A445FSG5_GLYSO|nr:Glutathione S-transferase U18 [Glycine soja]
MASLDSLSFKSIFRNRLFQDHDEDQVNLCLMTKSDENNKEDSIRKKWYIDSGCSKHMTGDVSKFTTISPKKSGHVTYGDNNKGKIIGVGKIGTSSSTPIENVLLVEESLGKFDAKADEGIFLGYSLHSKAFRIYNKRTMTIEESIHVTFDETNITSPRKEFVDDITDTLEDTQNEERNLKRKRDDEDKDDQDDTAQENDNLPKEWKTSRNHPLDNIIGDISKGEEVYVEQPPGFEDSQKLDHVYRLRKALYGLKQAPRACEFEMSMMGELNYFLGLQIKQTNDGIFVNQSKYCKELIKRFGMENSKHLATPMNTSCYLDKDESGQPVDPKQYRGYSDSDFAGSKTDKKSTSGTCQFIGSALVSWNSKKQNSVALSTAEAEYISADKKKRFIEEVRQGLALLKDVFKSSSKGMAFYGGNQIGFLDIALGSFLGWLRVTEISNAVKLLDQSNTPELVKCDERFCAHGVVKDVMPEIWKVVEFAKTLKC